MHNAHQLRRIGQTVPLVKHKPLPQRNPQTRGRNMSVASRYHQARFFERCGVAREKCKGKPNPMRSIIRIKRIGIFRVDTAKKSLFIAPTSRRKLLS